MVDVYNKRHEKLNYTKEKKELAFGEYRLSCFAWLVNNKGEILIQQRSSTSFKFPNVWETVSGGAEENDTSLSGTIREIKEELGIDVSENDMMYVGCYARTNDFVEIWLVKCDDIDVDSLKLQEEEVQAAKWVTLNEFENMIASGDAIDSGYSLFKQYYENFYNKHTVFINGKPILIKND